MMVVAMSEHRRRLYQALRAAKAELTRCSIALGPLGERRLEPVPADLWRAFSDAAERFDAAWAAWRAQSF